MDATTFPPAPINEPNLTYAPGTPEREALVVEIDRLARRQLDLKAHIGGSAKVRRWQGDQGRPAARPPARARGHRRTPHGADATAAINAAAKAAPDWRAMPFDERCAILLKAADLLAGPWRQRLNAATMLGQSKTAFQAEIDGACELIDFWRFNVHYAKQILADQPIANSPGIWNRTDHRPLEGFVYAITPFNFTAIAGNLPTAPALMGNTVIWKPSTTQQLAASLTMQLLEEAGHAARCHQHAARHGARRLRGGAFPPRPRRYPLHGIDRRVPEPVARRSARTSPATAPTRASWARPAARTSSSPTPRPTPT